MKNAPWDRSEPVVVEEETADARQDAVDRGDLVTSRVEQLERRQCGQFHRYVGEMIVRDEQRTETTETRERHRYL